MSLKFLAYAFDRTQLIIIVHVDQIIYCKWGLEPISELPAKASLSKRGQVPNYSYDNEFNLHLIIFMWENCL